MTDPEPAPLPRTAAIIVAAGRGLRAGGGVPKQWRELSGKTVAARTFEVFAGHPGVARIVLVLHPDDIAAGVWTGPRRRPTSYRAARRGWRRCWPGLRLSRAGRTGC